jgi:hypothetical protein
MFISEGPGWIAMAARGGKVGPRHINRCKSCAGAGREALTLRRARTRRWWKRLWKYPLSAWCLRKSLSTSTGVCVACRSSAGCYGARVLG